MFYYFRHNNKAEGQLQSLLLIIFVIFSILPRIVEFKYALPDFKMLNLKEYFDEKIVI